MKPPSTVAPTLDAPVRHILARDADFPPALRAVTRPAVKGVWVAGECPAGDASTIAIVGSRAASGVARDTAHALASALGGMGHAIVSGGAFGVDAAAHEGALDVGAASYAVLGCGINVIYPDRHASLYQRLCRAGGLLSEYGPGVPPRPGQFPVRNRIIVGLSRAVIVVQAAPRSGALVTARLATAAGKPLLAVPGSAGTDWLIARGQALPVRDAQDVAAALRGDETALSSRPGGVPPGAGPEGLCAAVVAAVAAGHKGVDALVLALARPVPEILAVLCEAELEGWLVRGPGNQYEVTRGG